MKTLRTAREAALQVLFQRGFQDSISPQELFAAFAAHFTFDNQTRDYAFFLVTNVISKEEQIHKVIERYSDNWRLGRIALIDKILLQVAIFELCFSSDTPTAPKLCMTDIIDLAKKYSSLESKNFINGILDKVFQQELAKTP